LEETGRHSKRAIRILLVDDHSLFRAGIASLLSSREDMEVVGEAQDGRQALDAARNLKPDLVLMDVHMPNLGGIEATRQIRAELPETRVVMLTVSDQDRDLFEAIKSGASGYLLKNLEPDELFGYLTGVFRGEAPISRTMAAKILSEFSSQASRGKSAQPNEPLSELTPREREVLKLVAAGATNREIAAALTLTENTVKNHLRNILDKLHLENRVQAAAYALKMGLTEETEG
jgi:two-component system, NarL family, nitrate/nitrite response regulator NarL